MSGLEVVGVVLGVLPLLIAAAEHYDDVLKPFKRFKRCGPELQQYQQQLKTQKTIFLNQCQLLLFALTNRDSAKEMFWEREHPGWNDTVLKNRLVEHLGSSKDACEATIKLITEKLKSIEDEAEGFGLILQQSPLGAIRDKAWLCRIQKKLRFSFSESRLNEYLDDLRKLNLDFKTLSKQTTKLDHIKARNVTPKVTTIHPAKKVEECKLVQRASLQLYDAMSTACQNHLAHSAHFQLLPQNIRSTETEVPFVRFNMAFSHGTTGAIANLEPVWISVDTSFADTEPATIVEENKEYDNSPSLIHTLTDLDSSDVTSSDKFKAQKRVRFASSTVNPPAQVFSSFTTASITATSISYQHSLLPDFCIQHDFCTQLRKFCGSPRSPQNKYIGYFQKTGPYKHLVYFAPPVSICNYTNPETLASILSSISRKSETDQLLEYERLRLAARLASAVLQFHATPLLRDFWKSEDVIFFGGSKIKEGSGGSALITSPHLNVEIGPAKGKILTTQNTQLSDDTTAHLIRNPYLFSLGVTLIELAFQAPLRSLYRSTDFINGQSSRLSDFLVATRLSKTISSSLGSTYGTVVRKCLGCDFGQGTSDLNEPKLQTVFYQDVVCELERLERGFAMLQLGA